MNTLQVSAESSWLVHAGAAAILYTHIAGGTLGILSGSTALALRKGSRRHALAGRVFVVSMLVMTLTGAAVAPFLRSAHGDPKLFDALVGLFICYLVATGWMTVKRNGAGLGAFEIIACVLGFLMAGGAILLGIIAKASADGFAGGSSAGGFFFLGGLITLAAALDLKVILKGGATGTARISRHVWRIGLALWGAVAAFFLGLQRVMPEFIQGSPLLLIPPLAIFAVVAFWLVRVRFGKRLPNAFAPLRKLPAAPPPGIGRVDGQLVRNAAE